MIADVLDLREEVARDEECHALVGQRPDRGPRISTIPAGSSPLVGSSRMRSEGFANKAAAMPSRCFMPSEYRLIPFTGTIGQSDPLEYGAMVDAGTSRDG